eukprot:scaffold287_cov337-Pavlova_lutheri.AAC.12
MFRLVLSIIQFDPHIPAESTHVHLCPTSLISQRGRKLDFGKDSTCSLHAAEACHCGNSLPVLVGKQNKHLNCETSLKSSCIIVPAPLSVSRLVYKSRQKEHVGHGTTMDDVHVSALSFNRVISSPALT